MKKKIIYIISFCILLSSIFLLTGCGSDSSKQESAQTSSSTPQTPTTIPSSSVTTTPVVIPTVELTTLPTASPLVTPVATASSTANPNTNSDKTKVEKPNTYVTWAKWQIDLDSSSKRYMTITATDEVKDVVWTYTTDSSNSGALEFLGEYNQKLFINELGKIVSIDKQTGSVIWTNNEYNGKDSHYKFDNNGYMYITSSTTPALFVIDSTGKTVRKEEKLNGYDSSKVSELSISDNSTLKITYSDNKELNLSLSNIKDSSKNIL